MIKIVMLVLTVVTHSLWHPWIEFLYTSSTVWLFIH